MKNSLKEQSSNKWVKRTFGSTSEIAHLAQLNKWTLDYADDPELEATFQKFWHRDRVSLSGWYMFRLLFPINLPFAFITSGNASYDFGMRLTRILAIVVISLPWITFTLLRRVKPALLETRLPTYLTLFGLASFIFLILIGQDYVNLVHYSAPSTNPSTLIFNLMIIEGYMGYYLRPFETCIVICTSMTLGSIMLGVMYSVEPDFMLRDLGILFIANMTTGLAAYREYAIAKLMFRDSYSTQKTNTNTVATTNVPDSRTTMDMTNGATSTDKPLTKWQRWFLHDAEGKENEIRVFIGRKTIVSLRQVVHILLASHLALYFVSTYQDGVWFKGIAMQVFLPMALFAYGLGILVCFLLQRKKEKADPNVVQLCAIYVFFFHVLVSLLHAYLYYAQFLDSWAFHARLTNVIVILVTSICIIGFRFQSMVHLLLLTNAAVLLVIFSANLVAPLSVSLIWAWMLLLVLTSFVLAGASLSVEQQARQFYKLRHVRRVAVAQPR